MKEEVELALREMRGEHLKQNTLRNYLFDYLQQEDAKELEKIRLGKTKESRRGEEREKRK